MVSLPLRYRIFGGAVLLVALGITLNPWVVQPDWLYDSVGERILIAEGFAGIGWCVWVCVMRLRTTSEPNKRSQLPAGAINSSPLPAADPSPQPSPPRGDGISPGPCHQCWIAALLFLYVLVLWLVLFHDRWRTPTLFADDYHYVEVARNWSSTYHNLFTPYNEHFCVLTRLLTWAVRGVAAPAHAARALVVAGMALFAAATVLLYWFVRREWGSPALGLVAASLFALTSAHREVVLWYSASQWCWALLLSLAALLVLQGAGPAPSAWRLIVAALAAALGPLNFAVGLLVGPLASLYLLARNAGPARLVRSLVPVAGTAAALLAIVPVSGPGILARADYGGRPPAEAVSVLDGALFGVRCTVDVLMLENIGIERRVGLMPRLGYALLLALAALAVTELVRSARRPGPAILGFSFVLLAYSITLPFRAWVEYESFLKWTRYQLFPQVGVTLLVCSTLAELAPAWLVTDELTGRQVLLVLALAAAMFVLHVST